jgi:carboxypeptidase C (cathepsin A)
MSKRTNSRTYNYAQVPCALTSWRNVVRMLHLRAASSRIILFGRFIVFVVLLGGAAANTQGHPTAPESLKNDGSVVSPSGQASGDARARDVTVEGAVTLAGGKRVTYTVVAGLLSVGSSDVEDAKLGLDGRYAADVQAALPAKPEDRPALARMFYTAYIAKGVNTSTRPLIFFYNGGPGSATMYLRMNSLGPLRLNIADLEHAAGGPYRIVENPYTLLDVADLVFIDAPGTGYSRIEGHEAMKAFYGIDPDAAAFDRFIRRFLTRFDRWSAAKFLFGESYGTTRNAVLSCKLQEHGVDLNGMVFLSQLLSFDNNVDFSDGNPGTDNSFFLALPSFAATAWYHHRVPNQPTALEPWIHEVEQYALVEYASALIQGDALDPVKKRSVAERLENYTGVPASIWISANLRITGVQFSKYVQLSTGVTTGHLDARYEGPTLNALSATADYDPFTAAIEAPVLAAMNTYAHDTLKFGLDLTYKPNAAEPGFNWDMSHHFPGGGDRPDFTSNVMPDLAHAMTINPRMRILLMGGYFDLATLYFGATYEMKHLGISSELQKNIEYQFFPTGHMVYINDDALRQVHARVASFVRQID